MKYFKSHYLYILMAFALVACKSTVTQEDLPKSQATNKERAIETAILNDPASFYHVDFKTYPQMDKRLPIGVFDSGTGGLTVLDALVNFDGYNNDNKEKGGDAVPDFISEKFIYLADQANMPYGNYSSENKTELLVEHILKDMQFLLSDKYYREASDTKFQKDKQPVKSIVIACNTATAYGSEFI